MTVEIRNNSDLKAAGAYKTTGIFGKFLNDSSGWLPSSIIANDWNNHAPFSFWLTSVLLPHCFVDFGVDESYSYQFFCEAGERLSLDMNCFSVRPKRVDAASESNVGAVFVVEKKVINHCYGASGQPVTEKFDTAGHCFDNASIDLLHLDGRACVDNIGDTFNTWLPKLSNRAVVLIDRINHGENDRDKFWDDVSSKYPSFAFDHGCGLGLLGVGPDIPEAIRDLSNLSDEETAQVRRIYAALGTSLAERQRVAAALDEKLIENANLRGEIEGVHQAIAEKQRAIAAVDEFEIENAKLRDEVGETRRTNALLQRQLAAALADGSIIEGMNLNDDLAEARKTNAMLKRRLADEQSERLSTLSDLKGMLIKLGKAMKMENLLQSQFGTVRDSTQLRLQNFREAADALFREVQERLVRSAADVAALEREREIYRVQLLEAQQAVAIISSSILWRAATPLRRVGTAVPASARRAIRRGFKLVYWALTPWAMPDRLRYLRDRARQTPAPIAGLGIAQGQPPIAASDKRDAAAPAFTRALAERFNVLAPLSVFRAPGEQRRITMVTDSINAGSLFGGVGTALVLSTLMARHLGARLRLITRTEPPQRDNVATVLSANRIEWNEDIEFSFAPVDGSQHVSLGDDEIFLTTSWWTTRCVRPVLDPRRMIYLLQEDERMFYPYGDDRLRCAETLSDPAVRFVINSEMLFNHLTTGVEPLRNITANGVWFEPAFPAFADASGAARRIQKQRRFFFYARPNNLRNLYWRGLEALTGAIEERILNSEEWEFYFVGRDLREMDLPGGVKPILRENLAWSDYAQLIRQIDIGLSLMDTPHPSYPPLDLAAAGAVVVTNRHGTKTSLARYCENIICVEPTVAALRQGIADAVKLADDPVRRRKNLASARIGRDWEAAFAPVLRHLFPG
jgi:hypothetical protein